jgi:hypothetical protein
MKKYIQKINFVFGDIMKGSKRAINTKGVESISLAGILENQTVAGIKSQTNGRKKLSNFF